MVHLSGTSIRMLPPTLRVKQQSSGRTFQPFTRKPCGFCFCRTLPNTHTSICISTCSQPRYRELHQTLAGFLPRECHRLYVLLHGPRGTLCSLARFSGRKRWLRRDVSTSVRPVWSRPLWSRPEIVDWSHSHKSRRARSGSARSAERTEQIPDQLSLLGLRTMQYGGPGWGYSASYGGGGYGGGGGGGGVTFEEV